MELNQNLDSLQTLKVIKPPCNKYFSIHLDRYNIKTSIGEYRLVDSKTTHKIKSINTSIEIISKKAF